MVSTKVQTTTITRCYPQTYFAIIHQMETATTTDTRPRHDVGYAR